MIVVDASVAIEILAPTERGQEIEDRVFAESRHAPYLIDIEFASGIRRLVLQSNLAVSSAECAIESMRNWNLDRHAHLDLLPRIWELRDSVSAYDATYIALAELLKAPLFTCDGRLARSRGHRVEIVLLQ